MRDDLSPRDIINAAMKRQRKRRRKARKEEASLDTPDFGALIRKHNAMVEAKVREGQRARSRYR